MTAHRPSAVKPQSNQTRRCPVCKDILSKTDKFAVYDSPACARLAGIRLRAGTPLGDPLPKDFVKGMVPLDAELPVPSPAEAMARYREKHHPKPQVPATPEPPKPTHTVLDIPRIPVPTASQVPVPPPAPPKPPLKRTPHGEIVRTCEGCNKTFTTSGPGRFRYCESCRPAARPRGNDGRRPSAPAAPLPEPVPPPEPPKLPAIVEPAPQRPSVTVKLVEERDGDDGEHLRSMIQGEVVRDMERIKLIAEARARIAYGQSILTQLGESDQSG